MAWRFSKSKKIGPFKTTITQKGIGSSLNILGFRFGVNQKGKKYWSFKIPGTGFHYKKYYK